MLSLPKLYSALNDALQSGFDGAESTDVADAISDAITDYAADAEIVCLPGPILIPGAPPVVSSAFGSKQPLVDETIGKAALTAAINAQFEAQDPTMMVMANGIVAYVAATFVAFSATGMAPPMGDMVTGVTVMSVPPPLTPVVPAGLAGAEIEQIAAQMASIIHASFKASIFTGLCAAKDLGAGPVSGPIL